MNLRNFSPKKEESNSLGNCLNEKIALDPLEEEVLILFKKAKENPPQHSDPEKIRKLTDILEQKELVKNCVTIANILMNEDKLLILLVELNNRLVKLFEENDIDIKGSIKNNIYSKGATKIFLDYILDVMSQYGFRKQYANITNVLSENDFNQIIINKFLFIDSSFRYEDHGEFTHLLQWFLFALALEKGMIVLTMPLADIYANCGEQLYQRDKESVDAQSLWDIIVDKQEDRKTFQDNRFRSPENLYEYLADSEEFDIEVVKFLVTIKTSEYYKVEKQKKYNLESYNHQDKLEEKYKQASLNKHQKYYTDEKISKNVLFNKKRDHSNIENANINNKTKVFKESLNI